MLKVSALLQILRTDRGVLRREECIQNPMPGGVRIRNFRFVVLAAEIRDLVVKLEAARKTAA